LDGGWEQGWEYFEIEGHFHGNALPGDFRRRESDLAALIPPGAFCRNAAV